MIGTGKKSNGTGLVIEPVIESVIEVKRSLEVIHDVMADSEIQSMFESSMAIAAIKTTKEEKALETAKKATKSWECIALQSNTQDIEELSQLDIERFNELLKSAEELMAIYLHGHNDSADGVEV